MHSSFLSALIIVDVFFLILCPPPPQPPHIMSFTRQQQQQSIFRSFPKSRASLSSQQFSGCLLILVLVLLSTRTIDGKPTTAADAASRPLLRGVTIRVSSALQTKISRTGTATRDLASESSAVSEHSSSRQTGGGRGGNPNREKRKSSWQYSVITTTTTEIVPSLTDLKGRARRFNLESEKAAN